MAKGSLSALYVDKHEQVLGGLPASCAEWVIRILKNLKEETRSAERWEKLMEISTRGDPAVACAARSALLGRFEL